MKVEKLDVSIERQAQEEYEACQIQQHSDGLENQKFLTEYVACMAGIDLPEEEEDSTNVQDSE